MRKNNSDAYFNELCAIVWNSEYPSENYTLLLKSLFDTEFTYYMEMDENRASHGIELRQELGFRSKKPCNVLEMMVALSQRMEDIMYEMEEGDRTSKWFWTMIESMDIDDQDDMHFDEETVFYAIHTMLNREYAFNGRGGLFTVHETKQDMREVDIWYQMHKYIQEISQ